MIFTISVNPYILRMRVSFFVYLAYFFISLLKSFGFVYFLFRTSFEQQTG